MPGDKYVGSIDQGTTGTRFMVFDSNGDIKGDAYRKHEQIYPEPGWVEHSATEIWTNTTEVILEAINDAEIHANQLDSIGVTNQRETTVIWDRETGIPIYNALVWQDRRTTPRVNELKERGLNYEIKKRTGLEVDAYFSATKAEWLLQNADPINLERIHPDDVMDRAKDGDLLLGTIDSWLIYKLTGNHVTDPSNASRTMLYNIHEMQWDDYLLEEFSVPHRTLPDVRPSSDSDTYGTTNPNGFLGAEIPVTAALGDQQAALFGQTCFDKGDAKNTYGTGSFLLMNTGDKAVSSSHGLITTIAYQLSDSKPVYALEGSIFATGAAIQWLEDVGLIENAAETEELSRRVDSTDDVYFVPAFTGLGAPHWDGDARGTIIGLTRGTKKEHIVRATLESIAYQTRDVVEAMEEDSEIDIVTIRVDGGAVKNNFLCQIQADLVCRNIVRPMVDETTALGAAYAAGLATGYWEGIEELRENWALDKSFSPGIDGAEADKKHKRWREAVKRSGEWARIDD